ncbi:MAG: hypothetical protein L3J96_04715 [Thermoplasmata archaeon]|nr:hypothetical protein [Thermoplasmata archaeon]
MVEFLLDVHPTADDELRSAFRWAGLLALLVGFGGFGFALYWGTSSFWDVPRAAETVGAAFIGAIGAWLLLAARSSRFAAIIVDGAGIEFARSGGRGLVFSWTDPNLVVEITDLTRVARAGISSAGSLASHPYWIRVVSRSRVAKTFIPREAFDLVRDEATSNGFLTSGVSRLGEPPQAVSWKLHRSP